MTLGLPPRQFDFAYRDKDDNYRSEKGITPRAFFENMLALNSATMYQLSTLQQLINLTENLTRLRCWEML